MFKIGSGSKGLFSSPNKKYNSCFLVFSLCFTVGCVLGCFVGSVSGSPENVFHFSGAPPLGLASFFLIFLRISWFHIFAAALGSSFLGIGFLPILAGVRGYALSLTAASIILSNQQQGIIMALILLAVPALLSLPCFFIISVDAFFSSRRLLELHRGRSSVPRGKLPIHCLICAPILILAALLQMKLIPYLISLLN
ncbi:MAG: hypothetical protein RSD32_01840 [Oscillospiraceae bacterium]